MRLRFCFGMCKLKMQLFTIFLFLQEAEVPWHLIAMMMFFTLIKLPGPYYPYWGRLFVPHFANGVLLRALLSMFFWYKKTRNTSGNPL